MKMINDDDFLNTDATTISTSSHSSTSLMKIVKYGGTTLAVGAFVGTSYYGRHFLATTNFPVTVVEGSLPGNIGWKKECQDARGGTWNGQSTYHNNAEPFQTCWLNMDTRSQECWSNSYSYDVYNIYYHKNCKPAGNWDALVDGSYQNCGLACTQFG